MNAITIKGLNKIYGDGTQALVDVDLEVSTGDFFALLGANGAGKTTMIGVMTGLVNKTSGRVRIFQHDIDSDFIRARKLIGVVPQEFNFSVFEKVEDIIVTQAGYFGIERKRAKRDTQVLLKKLGLWEKRLVPSRVLSGGMKRRLMIARALVHHPKLLILDEPTAGVDVELRHGMWDYLRELNRQGITILLTTHYLEEVEQMCRHAAIIKEGRIITNDKVSRLVQYFEKETYVITVDTLDGIEALNDYSPKIIDANSIEVDLNRKEDLHAFLMRMEQAAIRMTDIRPKGHRMEKLFLSLLNGG